MVEISLNTRVKVSDTRQLLVVYNLIRSGEAYDIECFLDGEIAKSSNDYCYIKGITKEKEVAGNFIHKLAKGQVLPIHIKDIVEDEFYEELR